MAVRATVITVLLVLVSTASARDLTRDKNQLTSAGLTEAQCKAEGAGKGGGIAANACKATTVRAPACLRLTYAEGAGQGTAATASFTCSRAQHAF